MSAMEGIGSDDSFGGGGAPPRGRRRGSRFGKFGIRPKRVVQPAESLDYKNVSYLATFVGPTGKILSRRRTGFSGQNQRKLTRAIKLARFMALLPYIGSAADLRQKKE
jgi:small subunit ribosomal protein S18